MCISLHFHFTFHAPSLVLKKKKTGTAIFVFPFFGCHYYFCFHCIFFPFSFCLFFGVAATSARKKNKTSGFCFEFFPFSFWNGQWEYLYVSACLSTPTASLDITLVCYVCFFFNLEQNVKKLQKIK